MFEKLKDKEWRAEYGPGCVFVLFLFGSISTEVAQQLLVTGGVA